MKIISISRPITIEQSDVYVVPENTPTNISKIRLVALDETTLTVFRSQSLDDTLYEILPPTALSKNTTLEILNTYLLPGDKIIAVSTRARAVIHLQGVENQF